MTRSLNFESDIFDKMIDRTLFYSPKIEIRPVHLANGFFRAICGKYAKAEYQQMAIYPKEYPKMDINEQVRGVLNTILSADGAVYRQAHTSSYTLSRVSHITRDNHDRRTGEWLLAILAHNDGEGPSPALQLLRELLTQDNRRRSDEISVLTLPLFTPDNSSLEDFKPQFPDQTPSSLEVDVSGFFSDPLLYSIRKGFDKLAAHDQEIGKYGGKLDMLRRMVVWGCFAIYLHLANSGREERNKRLPLLLQMTDKSNTTLEEASIQSYQWMGRSIDSFLRKMVSTAIEILVQEGTYGSWETDADVMQHISDMNWQAGGHIRKKEEKLLQLTERCLYFYASYLSDTANLSPSTAFANAVTDLIDQILSSSPRDVAGALATRIGLLPSSRRQKYYTPMPDLLEVLVRASVPPGQQWTINELAAYWADNYGLLFGALGNENDTLANWGISLVNGSELYENINALADILEMSGYARRYADGVVLVSVRE